MKRYQLYSILLKQKCLNLILNLQIYASSLKLIIHDYINLIYVYFEVVEKDIICI